MFDKETLSKVIEILMDEKRILEAIVGVEEEKVEILSQPGFTAVDHLDRQESELVESLNALEKERFFTAATFSRDIPAATLRQLVEAVPDEEKGQLVQIQHSITAVVARLQFLKSVTIALIDDKKKLADLTLKAASGEGILDQYNGRGTQEVPAVKGNPLLMDRSI